MYRVIPFQIHRTTSFSSNLFLPESNYTALIGFFALQDSTNRVSTSLFTDEVGTSEDTMVTNATETIDTNIFIQNFIARIMVPMNIQENAPQRMPETQFTLSSQKYQSIETNQITCSICTEDFKQKHKVSQLNCGHIFHTKCIKEWSHYKSTCPLCRVDLS